MEIENTDSHIPSTSTAAKLTRKPKQKEPSKARPLPTLQAHPSIGKDYSPATIRGVLVCVCSAFCSQSRAKGKRSRYGSGDSLVADEHL